MMHLTRVALLALAVLLLIGREGTFTDLDLLLSVVLCLLFLSELPQGDPPRPRR